MLGACQSGLLFPGVNTPHGVAKILVDDSMFGDGGVEPAIRYGDLVIPHIVKESNDFAEINEEKSASIARVLGSIHTDLSRSTLRDLYGRKDKFQRLVGAIGLSMQGLQTDSMEAYLVQTVKKGQLTKLETRPCNDNETGLAIIALGYSRRESALPVIHEVLASPNCETVQNRACEAVARIRSGKSIPVLRACLRNPEFTALPVAYRSATALGDKEATGLAIERISLNIKRFNSGFVVNELQRVTGKRFGYDKDRWLLWWRTDGVKWKIPQRFLVLWDRQPFYY